MRCERCGRDTYVDDSRSTHLRRQETVWRRRRCEACGFKFTTYEVRARVLQEPRTLTARRQKLLAMMQCPPVDWDAVRIQLEELWREIDGELLRQDRGN